MSKQHQTLLSLLRHRAECAPDLSVYLFLDDAGHEIGSATYSDLDQRARSIAALIQASAEPGDRVMLCFSPGRAFVESFIACIYAGVIAVPAYPPSAANLKRLEGIVNDCQAKLGLCDQASFPEPDLLQGFPALGAVNWLILEDVPSGIDAMWHTPTLDASTPCFLQYTSGSTGAPKGVIVSHQNLVTNLGVIQDAMQLTPKSRTMFWLPPFHDMGLVGGVLQALYTGFNAVLAPPAWFARRPERWIRAISDYRVTTSGAPNFAYGLCADRAKAFKETALDLSCWTVAFSGAEPVRAKTLEAFCRAYSRFGFQRRAFYPCYGLAEATLMVSGSSPESEPKIATVEALAFSEDRVITADGPARTGHTMDVVCCGKAPRGVGILIVDPQQRTPVEEGIVGEIWVHGGSITRGYWGKQERSRRTMHAQLADDVPASYARGPYLRTGDKGFLLGSDLYVAGRLSDMLIVRGRNIYPQDIEHTVENTCAAFRSGGGAAFTVGETGQELVVIQETGGERSQPTAIWEAARTAVATEHGVTLSALILIKQRTLPRTTSGKVRRAESKRQYLAGELSVVERLSDESTMEPHVQGPTPRSA